MNDDVRLQGQFLVAARSCGIAGWAAALQKEIKKPVQIFSWQPPLFQLLWPQTSERKNFTQPEFGSRCCYTDQKDHMVYRFGETSGLVAMVSDVRENEARIRQCLQASSLAAAFCQQMHQAAKGHFSDVEESFMRQILGEVSAETEHFLPLAHFDLNLEKPYVIQLLSLPDHKIQQHAEALIGQMTEYTESNCLPSMRPIYWQGYMVHIIPALYRQETFELCQEWPEVRVSEIFFFMVRDALQLDLQIGIGRIYPLAQLAKSFQEARIALAFRGLAQKGGYVQRFQDMGYFRYVFSSDMEKNRQYVETLLGPVIAYDQSRQAGFMDTLGSLLQTGLNWKAAASACGVHVNTIYYRVERMEKLLQKKLRRAEDRFELFTALRVWEVLKKLGVIEDAYIGSLEKRQVQDGKK